MTRGREQPFTDENLADAWRNYISSNPERKIIVNTMKACKPVRISGCSYSLQVPNPGVMQEFEGGLSHLVSFLRNSLSNDSLNISLGVAPVSETDRILSPAAHLKEIIKDNPTVGSLLRDLDAELI